MLKYGARCRSDCCAHVYPCRACSIACHGKSRSARTSNRDRRSTVILEGILLHHDERKYLIQITGTKYLHKLRCVRIHLNILFWSMMLYPSAIHVLQLTVITAFVYGGMIMHVRVRTEHGPETVFASIMGGVVVKNEPPGHSWLHAGIELPMIAKHILSAIDFPYKSIGFPIVSSFCVLCRRQGWANNF